MVAGAGEQKLLELLDVKEGMTFFPPDYNGFPLDKYLSPGLILPYSSARGCYWHKCAFCPEKAEGHPYLPLEISQVTEELQILTRLLNPALIHILDSSISPALLNALAQETAGCALVWFYTDHSTFG